MDVGDRGVFAARLSSTVRKGEEFDRDLPYERPLWPLPTSMVSLRTSEDGFS